MSEKEGKLNEWANKVNAIKLSWVISSVFVQRKWGVPLIIDNQGIIPASNAHTYIQMHIGWDDIGNI